MRKMDEDGMYPLSAKEHLALRNLYGAVNALLLKQDDLKERLKMLGLLEEFQQVSDSYCKILASILNTVPLKKQNMIRREMDNTFLYVSIGRTVLPAGDKGCYLDSDVLMNLINMCLKDHCFVCQKSYKEGTRHCPVFKAISDCYAYEFDQTDDCCPLQGVWQIEEDPSYKP